MEVDITRFNLRIYGILIDREKLLLIDEYAFGKAFTKFPGGGLEYGEGAIECLVREFREEAGINITVQEHFYTTDFFQRSGFDPQDQLISIYYRVSTNEADQVKTSNTIFDFEPRGGAMSFRWVSLKELTTGMVTFPIDKLVLQKLIDSTTDSKAAQTFEKL